MPVRLVGASYNDKQYILQPCEAIHKNNVEQAIRKEIIQADIFPKEWFVKNEIFPHN